MQNLAEFKRRAKPGARLRRRFPGTDIKPRFVTVAHAQSNAVVFPTGETTPEAVARVAENPARCGSWFYFPKASRCRFANGEMIVLDDLDRPMIAFAFVPPDTGAGSSARGDP